MRSQKKPSPQSALLHGLSGRHCAPADALEATHVKPNGQSTEAHGSGSGTHCATVGHSSILLLKHSSLGSNTLTHSVLAGQLTKSHGSDGTHSDFFWHSSMPS